MRLPRPVLLLALYLTPSFSLQQTEVGVVDWYKNLVGVPLTDSVSTAPIFHRVEQSKQSTRSVILTATGSNVLAALNPVNGSVEWRYIYDPEDSVTVFQKHKQTVASLSGPGGSTLRSFDVLTGHLILERRLHNVQEVYCSLSAGHLSEPDSLGSAIAFFSDETSTDASHSEDIFVLTNGHTLRRVDGSSGYIKWSWVSQDQSSLVIYSKIVATENTVYAIGLAKSYASYTLHITSLSTLTGVVLTTSNIHSNIPGGLPDLFISFQSPSTPWVVWLDQGSIRSFSLTPDLKGKPITTTSPTRYTTYAKIMDVGLGVKGMFVVIKSDGTSRVLGIDSGGGGGIKGIWDFDNSATTEHNTESIYSGGLDKDGFPYVSRVYWSHVLQAASMEVLAPHLGDGKGLVTGFSFPLETGNHGMIQHVALDAANPSPWRVLARFMITTTTGAIQLWQQDKVEWKREESLSNIGVAEFVELPELQVAHVAKEGKDGGEGFWKRTRRQLVDAQGLPRYVVDFIKRFATGSYASASTSASPSSASANKTHLSRDTFGFRQVIVVATKAPFGKLYGIDSSDGEILWSRVLGLGLAGDRGVGVSVVPVKLFVTRTVNDGAGDKPEVVLVTQRKADNGLVDTVLFHIDALTGEDSRRASASGDVLQGFNAISGPLTDAYLLQLNESRTVVMLDEFLQVYLYPETPEVNADFAKMAPSLHVPLRVSSTEDQRNRILGHQFAFRPLLSQRFVAIPTWTSSLPPDEEVQMMIAPSPSRGGGAPVVASIGRVLGNRTTLYKYLNPQLVVVLTSSSVAKGSCGVYVVDSVKGSIIYRAVVPSHGGGICDVKATLTENWLVYHYFDADYEGEGKTKGWRIVTVEFYEGDGVDKKTKSSEMSSFSEKMMDLSAHSQSYVFPYPITAITTTTTKFGVTSKDIIVASRNHKIHSIPRRLLDPRRPNRKLTSEEQEEMLIPYDPLLPDDPQRVLSHTYEVAHTERIVTAPSLLESTSLVFAYGLDLFFTRVAPSKTFDVLNEDFNKAQLVLTVTGLAVAIMITKPMVRRKRLRERWYQ